MRWIGILLLAVGMVIVVIGIAGAAMELAGTYQQVLDDPMATGGEDKSEGLPARMFIFVGIGAIGVVPMIVGGTMLRIGLMRKLLGRSAKPSS